MGGRSSKRRPGGVTRLGPAKRQRAGALRPLRVGEDVHAVELDQQRRVADPGDGGLGCVGAQRRAVVGDAGQARARRGAKVAAHMRRTKNVVRVQKGGRREVGIGVGEAVLAVVGGRARHRAADAAVQPAARRRRRARARPDAGRGRRPIERSGHLSRRQLDGEDRAAPVGAVLAAQPALVLGRRSRTRPTGRAHCPRPAAWW